MHGLYRLPDLGRGPDAGRAWSPRCVPQPVLTLTATYYDTGDLRLARSRVTLRRREGGGDDGWHLKLPADDRRRDGGGAGPLVGGDEVRLPLDDAATPPAALLPLVLGITRGADVEPVATLRTERRAVDLVDADGRVLAELTDDTVSVLDGSHVAARFRELEVESRDGTSAEIAAVVAALVASGAVEGGLPSKAVRALGPAALAPPDVPPADSRPTCGRTTRPAPRSGRTSPRNATAFLDQDLRVRRDLPDSVHQMRVAARRLRSGLKVFGPLVDPQWVGRAAHRAGLDRRRARPGARPRGAGGAAARRPRGPADRRRQRQPGPHRRPRHRRRAGRRAPGVRRRDDRSAQAEAGPRRCDSDRATSAARRWWSPRPGRRALTAEADRPAAEVAARR